MILAVSGCGRTTPRWHRVQRVCTQVGLVERNPRGSLTSARFHEPPGRLLSELDAIAYISR